MPQPASIPAHIRAFLNVPVQPMDQPELLTYAVAVRWSEDRQAYEFLLGDTWFHQDEVERGA